MGWGSFLQGAIGSVNRDREAEKASQREMDDYERKLRLAEQIEEERAKRKVATWEDDPVMGLRYGKNAYGDVIVTQKMSDTGLLGFKQSQEDRTRGIEKDEAEIADKRTTTKVREAEITPERLKAQDALLSAQTDAQRAQAENARAYAERARREVSTEEEMTPTQASKLLVTITETATRTGATPQQVATDMGLDYNRLVAKVQGRDSGAQGAAPPEGTRVRGPDGKVYVVRNGQPVPE